MNEIVIVRRIAARPSIVFDALSTAEGLTSWWGPDDFPVLSAEADVRLGGKFLVKFKSSDGLEHTCVGAFLDIVKPERIAMTWQWIAGGEPEEKEAISRVEMRLRPIEGGTEFTLIHAALQNDISARNHERGWGGALDKFVRAGFSAIALVLALLGTGRAASAQDASDPYAVMAPVVQYFMPNRVAEIAQARSAAPPSVSNDAEVMTLDAHGYKTAAKGTNGFVCLVQRAWFGGLEDAEFWNPKGRAPICFNPQAVRSVLPTFLKRTEWVLAGATRADLIARTKAAIAAKQIPAPETGSVTYMMARDAYLNDAAGGPWHPHLMFFVPRTNPADWGANLAGTQLIGGAGPVDPWSLFMVPVAKWSDGTPDGK